MSRRLHWERGNGTADASAGGVFASVREDRDITPPFVWVVTGCCDDRYAAMDAADRATLASIATGASAPEWLMALSRLANTGEAYLTVNGVRDMHTLPTILKMAIDGADGPQIAIVEKNCIARKRGKS